MAVLDVPPGGPAFSLRQRSRATRLYQDGRAERAGEADGEVRFVVHGRDDHAVTLRGREGDWSGGCDCPDGVTGEPCEHLLAAAWTEWDPGGDEAGAPWRAVLAPAEAALARGGGGAGGTGEPDVRLVAVLADREGETFTLELRAQARRKDGRWGTPRRLPGDYERLERELDAVDRGLLERLEGARMPHEPGLLRAGTLPLSLAPTAAGELLPAFARAERLALELEPGGRVHGLDVDRGEPWTDAFRIVEVGRELVLAAHLRRGDETHELGEGDRLLPGVPLAILGGRLHRRVVRPELEALTAAARAGNARAPRRHAKAFVAAVVGVAGEALESAPGVRWDDDGETPRPLLFVGGVAEGRSAGHLLDCRLAAVYGAQEVTVGAPGPKAVRTDDGRLVLRDRAAERQLYRVFVAAGGEPPESGERGGDAPVPLVDGASANAAVRQGALPRLVRRLHAAGWVLLANGVVLRSPSRWRLSVSSGQDWFDLAGGLEFAGQVVPVPEILRAARERDGLVRLGDGRVGLLPERWLTRLRALDLGEDRGEEGLRFRDSQAFLFDALFSERELEVELEVDAGFRRLRERFDDFQHSQPREEPPGFEGRLRPYQKLGLGWLATLRELGLGGCLADEMGLGKTVQVLAHVLATRGEGGTRRPVLVVAPRSLAFQWIAETRRFAPELTTLDHRGPNRIVSAERFRAHDLIVTTYGTLRRDAARLSKLRFDTVVLDEATAIKNSASKTARAARLLRADHRLALTGTPVENHLGELWSLFEFLNPGMLGRAARFRKLLDPEADPAAQAEPWQDAEELAAERERFLSEVHAAVRPFLLRRHKEDVLGDLPPKSVETLYVELGTEQRARYDELRDHFRGQLLTSPSDVAAAAEGDGAVGGGGGMQVLEALLRLRQVACHPALLDPARANDEAAKLETLFYYLGIILEEPERKVLVFSQFTSFLDLVRPRVEAAGIDYELLTGRTRDRAARVRRFQEDPACRLFLISLKAGGHGLNLTAADTVFLLDPWWNPAVEAQAIDRAHRHGQTRPVFAYRLIARDTVEEKVVSLQQRKQALSDALLGPERSLLGALSREELEDLFS